MILYLHRFVKANIFKTNPFTYYQVINTLGILTASAGAVIYILDQSVRASDIELHPPKYRWDHFGLIRTLDHASIRRGYEVYKQVCASCHSLRFIAYRNLVGVTHTEIQAKAEAEEQLIEDGPDENGNMFTRPGKLSDYIPAPYPNEEAARSSNNGSFPPDLSYIVLAKTGGEDYIFSLLTGYCDPPAGINLREEQFYNPYFLGGAIAMAQPMFVDSAVYSDGTHAHLSQLAKDISTFLRWTAEPEYDERKLMMIKSIVLFTIFCGLSYFVLRSKFISLKTRHFQLKSATKNDCKN